jgi:hypothetical protein
LLYCMLIWCVLYPFLVQFVISLAIWYIYFVVICFICGNLVYFMAFCYMYV